VTPKEAIAIVNSKANGRTRWVGSEPYLDEVLVQHITALQARVAELEAVVAKLPTTADGVPVGPGESVYNLWEGKVVELAVINESFAGWIAHDGKLGSIIGGEFDANISECYSAEAAARAAHSDAKASRDERERDALSPPRGGPVV
jgi:hypothetical protein